MHPGSDLLDLPVDILSLVFSHILLQDSPIPLCPCTNHHLPSLAPVLLSHPAIHAIAAPLFYQGNLFTLDMTGTHSGHVRRLVTAIADQQPQQNRNRSLAAGGQSLLATPSALARIGTLQVRFGRLRGWIDGRVVPIVQTMAVSGSLSHLEVYMLNRHDTRMFPNGHPHDVPNLLKLLAEPDLHTAKLWVPLGEGAASTYSKEDGEVDWRRILDELDPEGREVAVKVAERV